MKYYKTSNILLRNFLQYGQILTTPHFLCHTYYLQSVLFKMKLNSEIKLISKNLVFVPYRKHHVAKYHNWMQSAELQKLTGSEPLTLEEEYKMQRKWRDDEDKCTFILLDKKKYEETGSEVESMIGDTNIFITDKLYATGEIEIMIAEKAARGKKFGWEAVIIMLLYGINSIKIERIEAKVGFDNEISLAIFNKLGFKEKSSSKVFKEVTLEKEVTEEWTEWLSSQVEYEVQNH